jgi:hypothetical protein
MNLRALPASCRQRNVGEALPTRRRQHLVGCTVPFVSQCTVSESWRVSTTHRESGLRELVPLRSSLTIT